MTTEIVKNEWKKVRIDECFDIQQGKQVSKSNRRGDNQHPFLRTANVFWEGLDLSVLDHMHFTPQEEEKFALREGDLLLCEGGDVGRTAMWKGGLGRCYYQNHLHRLRKKTDEIDPNFVFLYLKYAFVYARLYLGRANITTIPNLSKSRLSELEILLPPLTEQKAIVQILTTIQNAITEQEKLIAKLKELKRSMMQHLFTHGTKGEKTKMTEIGEVPESWDITAIGDLCDVKGGKRLPKGEKLTSTNTGLPYIRVTDLLENGVDVSNIQYLTPDIQKIISKYTISTKDVYISIAGSIGFVGIIPQDLEGANLTENAAKLCLKTKIIEQKFLMYWLSTDQVQRDIKSQTVKNAQPKLALARIQKLPCVLPSVAEQKQIVNTIDAIVADIASVELKLTLHKYLFKTLLYELVSGERRIKYN